MIGSPQHARGVWRMPDDSCPARQQKIKVILRPMKFSEGWL